jgi:hypothetical protein
MRLLRNCKLVWWQVLSNWSFEKYSSLLQILVQVPHRCYHAATGRATQVGQVEGPDEE